MLTISASTQTDATRAIQVPLLPSENGPSSQPPRRRTISPVDILAAHAAIEASARELTEKGASVIGVGGDHSVSLPLLRAAAAQHGPVGLVQLDAHTDTWDQYFGSKLTHGTMFRRAIEEGILDPHRSVQIGLRGSLYASTDDGENESLGFRTMPARDFDAEAAIQLVADVATGPVYLTVDIDVLDPAFAPGTGTPEVGGLSTRELLVLLRGFDGAIGSRLVGADVVEVSPPYDPAGVPALAGANAVYQLLGLFARGRIANRT
jgi:agmatinase